MSAEWSDELWMNYALALAEKGRYTTAPNPCVGCVITRDNQLLSVGWHAYPGGPHAEIHALAALEGKAQGATCYLNLEPCAHYGRTPPCCEALVAAGVRKVVVAIQDPNPKTSGAGVHYLRKNGVEVQLGVQAEASEMLNRAFLNRMSLHKPWVTLKLAQSLDGKIADSQGKSQWISGDQARRDVMQLRASHAAILTTAKTVLTDDPRLTVREFSLPGLRQPLRIVLDPQLMIPSDRKIFNAEAKTLIYTLNKTLSPIHLHSIEIVRLAPNAEGEMDLNEVLHDLAEREINSVLVEAGGHFSGKLVENGLVDELVLYVAGKILGDAGLNGFYFQEELKLKDKDDFKFKKINWCGQDIKMVAMKK